ISSSNDPPEGFPAAGKLIDDARLDFCCTLRHRRFWHQRPYRPTSIAATHIKEVNYFLLSIHKNQFIGIEQFVVIFDYCPPRHTAQITRFPITDQGFSHWGVNSICTNEQVVVIFDYCPPRHTAQITRFPITDQGFSHWGVNSICTNEQVCAY